MGNEFPRVKSLAVEISNDKIRDLVCVMLDYPTFRIATAGPNHHNYVGGLAQHTFEVASMCLSLYNTMDVKEAISKDFLMAGALLHDVGKAYMPGGELYRNAGCAHVFIGAYEVNKACEQFGIESSWREQLVHLIVEHGKDAVTTPMDFTTREAFLVRYCDILSASVWGHELPGFKETEKWRYIEKAKF